MFTYSAVVISVIDGDTVDLNVDLGFRTFVKIRTRLRGINAPETNTDEGKTARLELRNKLPIGQPVFVSTFKDPTDKYGRWLADIYMPDEDYSISQWMIAKGLAVPFMV